MNRVAVVGAGAWGTALALQAARAGCAVSLWARDPAPLRATRCSPHLPGHPLPDAVAVLDALPGAGFDAVLVTVPVQHLRHVAAGLRTDAPLVLCCKGIEAGTGHLPLEIMAALHPGVPSAVLTGPPATLERIRLAAGDLVAAGRIAALEYQPGEIFTVGNVVLATVEPKPHP